jgi:hypothetical protein
MQPSKRAELQRVENLNSSCFCIGVDVDELKRQFEMTSELRDLPLQTMFALMPVFISRNHLDRMTAIIRAIEAVVARPDYQQIVLRWAPEVARKPVNSVKGVFLSYDFHVVEGGPQLIEINTNAGGALLNARLARVQKSCCPQVAGLATGPIAVEVLEQTFFKMFLNEWRLARNDQILRRIAIVDERPQDQYLYPEFILFKDLFRGHGVDAVICDPAALQLHDSVLWHGEEPVDLVYNRLTDFMMQEPAHATLREAYLRNAVVLTPNPRLHAIYANKRNLVVLSDPERLEVLGIPEDIQNTLLSGIPQTRNVDVSNAEALWAERHMLFFKPAEGFGSRAAYRGDKLTKRVWGQITAGDYVAQALVPPSKRLVSPTPTLQALKFDVRNYVYDGAVQFITARLYQGQTTNFRTPGGGFAPVFTNSTPDAAPGIADCDRDMQKSKCEI